ncbi:GNAT family N-acetyltransferase [Roseovarius phycicola]|uniref:GNAT family N-acetyltransferase n=1 Tax=Roseovarius phycicola TaxID=3080976 RepID=A0ABZ2HDQ9_9RHOB
MTDVIRTERLVLRPLCAEDAARITSLIGSLDVSRWLTTVPHPYHVSDAEVFLKDHMGCPGCYAVTLSKDLIGIVSSREELGYWFGLEYWGNGLATEAAQALVADHFAKSQRTLLSGYHLGNLASARVLAKLGFEETHQSSSYAQALRQDVTVQKMQLTHTAWQALR